LNVDNQGLKESGTCDLVGLTLMILGVVSGIVFIIVFGRIEVPSVYYGTRTIWSGVMIATGIGIIFNGLLIGYLFQKIASILRYHENKSIEKAP
jgi:F0F1-type ATP synthase membrane subunit c/vacuolar-type H+-ATPase subunit K